MVRYISSFDVEVIDLLFLENFGFSRKMVVVVVVVLLVLFMCVCVGGGVGGDGGVIIFKRGGHT